jgi:hypothetical protein
VLDGNTVKRVIVKRHQYLAFFRFLSIKRVTQHRLRIEKQCGMLILEGRELKIIDVKDEEFIVYDEHESETPTLVGKDDHRIQKVELHPAFL